MRLYSTTEGIAREDDGALALLELPHPDLGALLNDGGIDAASGAVVRGRIAMDAAVLRAPVPRPGKVVVIGMNYRSHLREVSDGLGLDQEIPAGDPLFYLVPGSAVVGPGAVIERPPLASEQVDYEGELAVVIGRRATRVDAASAWGHVAGFTVCNDVTARDLQVQATRDRSLDIAVSKSFDTFKPLGPALVTADGFDEPLDLGIRTRVNGELRQDERTTDAIHSVAEVVAFVSQRTTLEPGDVISTGSPAGVGMWRGGTWLVPGDEVEIEIEHVGTLRNRVG